METIHFPKFTGLRCLMMPYIQGDPLSVPKEFHRYADIVRTVFFRKGDLGYLTIDESVAIEGKPHRGARARFDRALHTEAGWRDGAYLWGPVWGSSPCVTLDRSVEVILANNLDESCAIWDVVHENTTPDGDIGHVANRYPYSSATLMRVGEIRKIGILTPHESLPVKRTIERQFLRIVSSGVHGREPYFTENPILPNA